MDKIPIVFTPKQSEALYRMLQVMSQDRPSSKELITDPQETCLCGKKVPITSLEDLNTGVILTISNVCKDCRSGKKLDRETARIICVRCKRVVARISPGKDKTGFSFEKNKSYHLTKCAFCEPGLTESPIIEKHVYDEMKRIGKI